MSFRPWNTRSTRLALGEDEIREETSESETGWDLGPFAAVLAPG